MHYCMLPLQLIVTPEIADKELRCEALNLMFSQRIRSHKLLPKFEPARAHGGIPTSSAVSSKHQGGSVRPTTGGGIVFLNMADIPCKQLIRRFRFALLATELSIYLVTIFAAVPSMVLDGRTATMLIIGGILCICLIAVIICFAVFISRRRKENGGKYIILHAPQRTDRPTFSKRTLLLVSNRKLL